MPASHITVVGASKGAYIAALVSHEVRQAGVGPCAPLFSASPDIGVKREIVLEVGTGHGMVFRPLDEWVLPALEWAAGLRQQP